MRYLVLITTLAFLTALAAGQALGAGDYGSGKSGAQMEQQQEEFGTKQAIGSQRQQEMGSQQQEIGSQQQVSSQQLSSEQVRDLQQALKDKGSDPGQVDGILGPNTQQAIRDFQQEEGIAASGELNEQTLEALDLEAEEFMGVSPRFEEKESESMQQEKEQQDLQQPQEREERLIPPQERPGNGRY